MKDYQYFINYEKKFYSFVVATSIDTRYDIFLSFQSLKFHSIGRKFTNTIFKWIASDGRGEIGLLLKFTIDQPVNEGLVRDIGERERVGWRYQIITKYSGIGERVQKTHRPSIRYFDL